MSRAMPRGKGLVRRARSRPARPALLVHVTDARGRPARAGRGLGAWLARAAPRGATGGVAIALVSDAVMRRLNRDFRGVDRATDVLSFPSAPIRASQGHRPAKRPATGPNTERGPLPAGSGQATDLGDLAIAVGVARRQARQLGHPPATELRILALHGLLHLLGYDHEADQGEMGRLEDRLRRKAGLPSALIARARHRPAHR